MAAYDYVRQHAQAELGLQLVTAKCQVYTPPQLSPASRVAVAELSESRQLPHADTMESLGVMFGRECVIAMYAKYITRQEYTTVTLSLSLRVWNNKHNARRDGQQLRVRRRQHGSLAVAVLAVAVVALVRPHRLL